MKKLADTEGCVQIRAKDVQYSVFGGTYTERITGTFEENGVIDAASAETSISLFEGTYPVAFKGRIIFTSPEQKIAYAAWFATQCRG